MQKYAQIFVHRHFCSEMRTVFQEQSLRKTLNFVEQMMMLKGKCTSRFLHQLEAIVFIVLQIFVQCMEKSQGTASCLLHGMFSF